MRRRDFEGPDGRAKKKRGLINNFEFGIGIDDAREEGKGLVKGVKQIKCPWRMTATHNALAGGAEVVWPWLMFEIFLVLLLPLMRYTVRLFLFLAPAIDLPLCLCPYAQSRRANEPDWQLSRLKL